MRWWGYVRIRRAVGVREAVTDREPIRRLGLEDLPVAMMLVALGSGHVVLDATAGRQVVPGEGGGVGRLSSMRCGRLAMWNWPTVLRMCCANLARTRDVGNSPEPTEDNQPEQQYRPGPLTV